MRRVLHWVLTRGGCALCRWKVRPHCYLTNERITWRRHYGTFVVLNIRTATHYPVRDDDLTPILQASIDAVKAKKGLTDGE